MTELAAFVESNESMSLSQIQLLFTSFVFSRIESIFGMEVLWDNRYQPYTSLLW